MTATDDFFDRISDPCPLEVGTRVRLVAMPDDPNPVPFGTHGTVVGGNGGQIWMRWDNGSTLALAVGHDRWEVLPS